MILAARFHKDIMARNEHHLLIPRNVVQIELVFKDKLGFFRVSIAINIIDMPHTVTLRFVHFHFLFIKQAILIICVISSSPSPPSRRNCANYMALTLFSVVAFCEIPSHNTHIPQAPQIAYNNVNKAYFSQHTHIHQYQ